MPNVPPNQLSKPLFSDSDGVSPALQAWLSQMADTINSHSGYNGPVTLANHLDLANNRVMNVAAPVDETDAITSGVAQGKYSVQALAPQLEANSKTGLKSMRRVNDKNQREQSSSWLNDLMSSVPSANLIFPIITNGASVTVVIPASLFTWADGSTIMLISRTDLLSKPAQFAISTISSVGNLVTATTATSTGLSAGQAATFAGVTPASFNGTYGLASVSGGGTILTYQLDLGTLSGSGGFVQLNSVYYYAVQKRDPTVHLLGPFPSDTMQNRLQANFDGFQIVAVVVITNNGGQVSLSGGGGSPIVGSPTAGSFF